MSTSPSSITFITSTNLSFAWPDGAPMFSDLNWSVGPGRTGLIGLNGSGKSTLLRLITGELRPSAGSISVAGSLGYLAQDRTLDTDLRVDEALGISHKRAALRAIEAGSVEAAYYATIGDDWDVEERSLATLGGLGLGGIGFNRTIAELSGGETILLSLAGLVLQRPDVIVLDEPTNNLDRGARQRLYDVVESWPGVMLIVSHDRELLQLVDQIADLHDGTVQTYGGNFAAYEDALATEQAAAERMVRSADADVKRQRRDLIEARDKLAKRVRYGDKMYANKREPRAVMKQRKRTAQETSGKHRIMHEQKLEQARQRLDQAEEAVRDDDRIRIDLSHTAVPAARALLSASDLVLQFGAEVGDFDVRGPERIALTGPNGSGKTTLLRTIVGELAPAGGYVDVRVPLRFLPQRLDVLDDDISIVENVARHAPTATNNELRARLARFLFRASRADQLVRTLSGGERFRATLAALMLAEPAPQLLLLDEPTNNLDLASVEQLRDALESYRGGLIVASHDQPFLDEIGITRELHLPVVASE
jgi:ATPase subunit of ABC transporter with duplicated ATPase domains